MALQMSFDTALQNSYKQLDQYSPFEVLEKLKSYKQYSSILEELALYYHGEDKIFVSSGTASLNVFSKYEYMRGIDEESYNIALNSNLVSQYLMCSDMRYLHYIIQLSNSPGVKRTAVFILNNYLLADIVNSFQYETGISIYVKDSTGSILYTNNTLKEANEFLSRIPDSFAISDTSSAEPLRYGKQKNTLLSVKSSYTGWSFYIIVPYMTYYIEALASQKVIFIMMVVFLLLCTITIASFSFRQSKPLSDLLNYYETSNRSGQKINTAKGIANAMIRSNSSIMLQLQEQSSLARDQFIQLLFQDTTMSTHRKREIASIQALNPDNSFLVIFLAADNRASEKMTEQILSLIKEIKLPGGGCDCIPYMQENRYGILLNTSDNISDTSAFASVPNRIDEILKGAGMKKSVIGVGSPCSGLPEIGRSFVEARMAAEYSIVYNDDSIIYYDKIKNIQNHFTWYKINDMVIMTQSLRTNQRETACDAISSMIHDIRRGNHPPIMVRSMCNDIISQFIKTVVDMNLDYHSYMSLYNYESLVSLKDDLVSAAGRVFDELALRSSSRNEELFHAISQYILTNINSYNLSLSSLSDDLGFSASHISHIIKSITGQSFSEYVTKLRLDYVKKQLCESDQPIADIIISSGYINPSSFIRKFKLIEGMTPGEFRKKHRGSI
ncbi:MAG: helix-turn-helix domain-containing protein [Clostridiaceae bacterium]